MSVRAGASCEVVASDDASYFLGRLEVDVLSTIFSLVLLLVMVVLLLLSVADGNAFAIVAVVTVVDTVNAETMKDRRSRGYWKKISFSSSCSLHFPRTSLVSVILERSQGFEGFLVLLSNVGDRKTGSSFLTNADAK